MWGMYGLSENVSEDTRTARTLLGHIWYSSLGAFLPDLCAEVHPLRWLQVYNESMADRRMIPKRRAMCGALLRCSWQCGLNVVVEDISCLNE